MKEYFSNLFRYNLWANTQVMKVLLKQQLIPEKSLLWMSHIIAAEIIWFSRISEQDIESIDLWTTVPVDELKPLQEKFDALYISYTDRKVDFDGEVSYKNTLGISHKSKIFDILIHVANHGTYHRGQIAANLKANDIQPISTDFIFWKRETLMN
ncbi:MAG: hypothetical protein O2887_03660 [Bacteroidetes bacterium]|nr:hypothetical protein [Bacteroidota bacterium]MDA1119582.1 hypothetical protein [Bacteroidota bacterium]